MAPQKKKIILHITDSLDIGGTERLLVGTINDLDGFDHHLMILGGSERLLGELKKKIPFTNLGGRGLIAALSSWRRVKRYIKDNRVDIVHSHLYTSCILARLATPSNIPLYNSIHNIPSLDIYKDKKWILWLDRLTYRKNHRIIAVSREVLLDFERFMGKKGKVYVLYNFIEDKFWGRSRVAGSWGSSLKLVSVGNLRPPKNYPFAIEAFKRMPEGVSLDIYGVGVVKEQLQKEIDQFDLPIRLCGSCDHIESILPGYDAFLMTSHYEGFGIALFEAMAGGLPAILSDIPIFREVTGGNALFFGLEDPDNLVVLVKDILASKFDLEHFSCKGLKQVREMSGKSGYMKQLSEIYHDNI